MASQHFTHSEKSHVAGREFLKRFRLRTENRDPEVNEKAAPQENLFEYLKSIRQPTLVVNGSKDVIIYSVNSFILQQHLPKPSSFTKRRSKRWKLRRRSMKRKRHCCFKNAPS